MLDIQVGDMVMIPGRFWRVTGVYVDGFGEEGVVELQIVDRKSTKGEVKKLLVPEDILTQKMIYRATTGEEKLKNELERAIPRHRPNSDQAHSGVVSSS